jgi:hypothetical protein
MSGESGGGLKSSFRPTSRTGTEGPQMLRTSSFHCETMKRCQDQLFGRYRHELCMGMGMDCARSKTKTKATVIENLN